MDYKSEFDKAFNSADTSKQIEILKDWEKAEPKNPELYTSYFNYYFVKSKNSILNIGTEKPNSDNFSIEDSSGKTVGYIGNSTNFDINLFKKGIDIIDQGIILFPDRLDMRFGKIYALGQIEDWDNFTEEIIKTIKHSGLNNNQWLWTNNELKPNGKDFLLTGIQDYQLELYNSQNDSLLLKMREIAEVILSIFPDHIVSLSNISITYLLLGNYDKGIEVLLEAEKIEPKDAVVLGNIAQGYKLKGDKIKAKEYFEKILEFADEQTKNYVKQQIELLDN
jgi:tetratricopeptide (TPR) repeat protein